LNEVNWLPNQNGGMSVNLQSVRDLFAAKFKELKSGLEASGHEILLENQEPLENELVNQLSFDVEEILKSSGNKKSVVKRLFSSVVEALQNVLLHGEFLDEPEKIQPSLFLFGRAEDGYSIITGNLLFNNIGEDIERRLQRIQGLDKEALKELYMEVLTDGHVSSKGGAGLGFITIALKSKSKLEFEFVPVDNYKSIFILKTKVIFG